MSHKQIELEFKKSLEATDYGLIVGKHGELKGIRVPVTVETDIIPAAVVDLCVSKFGIDPNGSQHNTVVQ